MVNLNLKWGLIRDLVELSKLRSQASQCESFSKLWYGIPNEDVVVHQQMTAMQAISMTVELTENFAAMCFAYAEAVKHGPQFLPLLLRDFGDLKKKRYQGAKINFLLANADSLFAAMMTSGDILSEYLACKDQPVPAKVHNARVISNIIEFRRKYYVWYNKFKHTNSVFAVSAIFDAPGSLSQLHRIPDALKWSDDQVVFPDRNVFKRMTKSQSLILRTEVTQLNTESFLTAYQNLDDVVVVLESLERFWQPIRAKQHWALFGEEIPIYYQKNQ
jgi:hypothetical protein